MGWNAKEREDRKAAELFDLVMSDDSHVAHFGIVLSNLVYGNIRPLNSDPVFRFLDIGHSIKNKA